MNQNTNMLQSFDDVSKIEDLTMYPWTRRSDVQARYDMIKDKTSHIAQKLLKTKVLKLNDYPYDLPDDCLHYVLWSARPMTKDQVTKYLQKNLKDREYVAFTNLTKNKSVDIFHVHVICRK